MAQSINDRKRGAKPPRHLDPKHNQPPEDKAAKHEAERIQLLSFMNKFREADAACQASAAAHKANQDAKTEISRYAKAAIGVTRKQMDSYLADMNASKRDLVREEQTRRKHREMLGIITPEQLDMFADDAAPVEEKDEAMWRAEGYLAGMRMAPRIAPNGCEGPAIQWWLSGYDQGVDVMRAAMIASQKAEGEKNTADLEANAQGIDPAAAPGDDKSPEKPQDDDAPKSEEEPSAEEVIANVKSNEEGF